MTIVYKTGNRLT